MINENKLIIKQLNKFGRVPKRHELLQMIEQLQQEYQQLEKNYNRIYNENCKLREEHNITNISLLDENEKLKQEVIDLSKEVGKWNSYYDDEFNEKLKLKKQLEKRPKEYVFIGNAQNKTRDFINQILKENKELKKEIERLRR